MSGPFLFGTFRGSLSKRLVASLERAFAADRVSVVHYSDPRGQNERGWCEARNLGDPFNRTLAASVHDWLARNARGADRVTLKLDSEP